MAWTTPKTNWTSGNFFTYVDCDRILENILYLYAAIGVTPLYPTFLPNHSYGSYLYYAGYNHIQEEVFHLYGLIGGTSDYQYIRHKRINSSPWSSTELNIIESLLLECKQIVDGGDYILNYAYTGTEMYANDNALL